MTYFFRPAPTSLHTPDHRLQHGDLSGEILLASNRSGNSAERAIAKGLGQRALAIYARIQATLARRERQRVARRRLADDVAVRRALVGVSYAKRRDAQMRGRA